MTRGEKAAAAALAVCALLALCAPFLAADDGAALHRPGPLAQDLALRLASPGAPGRPLGADALGRDVFARLVHGLRTSLVVAGGGALVAFVFGLLVGAAIGATRGRAARAAGGALGALVDAGAAFPPIFVIVALQASASTGVVGLMLLLGALRAPWIARLVRQEALRVNAAPFVVAAGAAGVPPLRVFARYVLPHVAAPALVAAAFAVPGNVAAEAALSFLGVGLADPTASLGSLLRDGRLAVPFASHLVWIPGLVVVALTLACQTLADGVRRRAAAAAPEGVA